MNAWQEIDTNANVEDDEAAEAEVQAHDLMPHAIIYNSQEMEDAEIHECTQSHRILIFCLKINF